MPLTDFFSLFNSLDPPVCLSIYLYVCLSSHLCGAVIASSLFVYLFYVHFSFHSGKKYTTLRLCDDDDFFVMFSIFIRTIVKR